MIFCEAVPDIDTQKRIPIADSDGGCSVTRRQTIYHGTHTGKHFVDRVQTIWQQTQTYSINRAFTCPGLNPTAHALSVTSRFPVESCGCLFRKPLNQPLPTRLVVLLKRLFGPSFSAKSSKLTGTSPHKAFPYPGCVQQAFLTLPLNQARNDRRSRG